MFRCSNTRQVIIGRPLHSARAQHERLSKVLALPVFSSDAPPPSPTATMRSDRPLVGRGRSPPPTTLCSRHRYRRSAVDPHRVLSPDGDGLSGGGGAYIRRARQSGVAGGTSCRSGAAAGLHFSPVAVSIASGGGRDHVRPRR